MRVWFAGIVLLILALCVSLTRPASQESLLLLLARCGCVFGLGVAFGWLIKGRAGREWQTGDSNTAGPENDPLWEKIATAEARIKALAENDKKIWARMDKQALELSQLHRMLSTSIGTSRLKEVRALEEEVPQPVIEQPEFPRNAMWNRTGAARQYKESELKSSSEHSPLGDQKLNFEESVVRQWRAFWAFEGGSYKGDIAKLREFLKSIVNRKHTVESDPENADLARIRQEGSQDVLVVPLHHFFANIREYFSDVDDSNLPVATIRDLVSPAIVDQDGVVVQKGRVRIL